MLILCKMLKDNLFHLLVLVSVLSLATGQQPQQPQPNSQLVCSTKFESAVGPECFDANGIAFSGVILVLTNNRTGQLPAGQTLQTFVESLCLPANQDKVVPCVLQKMQQNNGSQCTQEDRMGVMGRGSQLLAFLENACLKQCENEALQSLAQCFAVTQISPEPILGQNASIIDDKYAIVGTNESEYTKFCSNRNKLFSCLGPLSTTCPSLLEKFSLIGVDLQGFESLAGVLCSDKDKFIKGLTCFKTPSPAITTCSQQTLNNMRNTWIGRYVTGQIPPSKYLGKLCEVKLTQMDCELQAFQKTCEAPQTELKTVAECTMLPKLCKENPTYQNVYNGMCQKVSTPASVSTVRPTLPTGTPGTISPRSGTIIGSSSGVTATEMSTLLLISLVGLGSLLM